MASPWCWSWSWSWRRGRRGWVREGGTGSFQREKKEEEGGLRAPAGPDDKDGAVDLAGEEPATQP